SGVNVMSRICFAVSAILMSILLHVEGLRGQSVNFPLTVTLDLATSFDQHIIALGDSNRIAELVGDEWRSEQVTLPVQQFKGRVVAAGRNGLIAIMDSDSGVSERRSSVWLAPKRCPVPYPIEYIDAVYDVSNTLWVLARARLSTPSGGVAFVPVVWKYSETSERIWFCRAPGLAQPTGTEAFPTAGLYRRIVALPDGAMFLVGTSGLAGEIDGVRYGADGLARYDGSEWRFATAPSSPRFQPDITDCVADHASTVWYATRGDRNSGVAGALVAVAPNMSTSVYAFADGFLEDLPEPSPFVPWISSLAYSGSTLWLGMRDQGLVAWTNLSSIRQYTSSNSTLQNDLLTHIAVDSASSTVWIASGTTVLPIQQLRLSPTSVLDNSEALFHDEMGGCNHVVQLVDMRGAAQPWAVSTNIAGKLIVPEMLPNGWYGVIVDGNARGYVLK
ncbi:MAG: hypothetical protein MUC47_08615, partial [Candidatus Kapabacteria bacterium]|nr:hypothetical protein [Candidatus Kapabacteria bacterium]